MLYAGVEDRGNFSGVRSPPQHTGPRDPTQAIRPRAGTFTHGSHLTGLLLGNSSLPKLKTELVSIATNSSILGVLNKLMSYEPCLLRFYTYGQGCL